MRKLEELYEEQINESGSDMIFAALGEMMMAANRKHQDAVGDAAQDYILKYHRSYKKMTPFGRKLFDLIWDACDYIPLEADEQGLL